MPIELTVQKINNTLVPVEQADVEVLQDIKNGQGFRVSITRVSDRSLKHHRLYWGGLVKLLSDYWEPESGLISKYDKRVMGSLIDWVAARGYETEALSSLVGLYLQDRAEKVKRSVPDFDKAAARLEDIHDWLKREAGYWEAVPTPTGVTKKLKSINFNALPSEEEFMKFYKSVFSVAWRYVFSKAKFKDEQEAMDLALQMSQMGR
jgi:hypothetical protein